MRDFSLLKRMMFWNRCEHSSAQWSPLSSPFKILTPQPQRRPFSWRFTWKSDNSHLQEASYKLVVQDTSLQYKTLSLQGGRPAPSAQHHGAHFAFGLGCFKNGINGKIPGKSQPSEFLIDFSTISIVYWFRRNLFIDYNDFELNQNYLILIYGCLSKCWFIHQFF